MSSSACCGRSGTYVISPLHLCQIVTLEYFKTRLGPLYREYLLPMTAVLLAAWILAWLHAH
ncbi:MAG: DUF401 family protein [bacterium]|nr:DUF401 family protein [bacterium]